MILNQVFTEADLSYFEQASSVNEFLKLEIVGQACFPIFYDWNHTAIIFTTSNIENSIIKSYGPVQKTTVPITVHSPIIQ